MGIAVFCDFDETITRSNVTDTVLERFADPLWLRIQDDWLAGRLSARKVLQDQMPLVRVSQEELDAFIDTVEVDPFFAEFARYCAGAGHSLYILSDGFDYWIHRILGRALEARHGFRAGVSVYACGLELRANRFEISFPYFPEGCRHGCATCKPGLFRRLKGSAEATVIVGDGRSDQLLAKAADVVIAKNGLRDYCEGEGIANHSFKDFSDVQRIVDDFKEKARVNPT